MGSITSDTNIFAGDSMEIVYFGIITILVALIVWYVMHLRSNKMLLEAQMESNIILAGIEAKENSMNDSLKGYEVTMKDTFTLLAKSAFDEVIAKADDEKTSSFSDATDSLSKALKEYSENMNNIEAKSLERGTRLEERINQVSQLGIKLSDETSNLTRALKADSQAQGAWGELVLENLLQSLGFEKDRDYFTQSTFQQEDGTRPRTDFIVQLPDNRQIVIDSKVSLTAWERYVNAENDSEMEGAMKEHCSSIMSHAKGLAAKNYQGIEGINTVDFVLMYVPLESAFSAAMRMNPDLYMEFAKDNHVRVVTGSTIVTTLMLIKEIWKRESQTKNQQKLVEETGKLYDKIVLFLESFEKVGKELNQASNAYEEALDRLSEGNGNIIRKTENLKKLGAKVTKEIGQNLLEEANSNHENASDSNSEA
jgi:DNA recombination protein RmuC